jgi:catechol 2,3-dioxygenase-like lactoylglutathione lyase family enzyme
MLREHPIDVVLEVPDLDAARHFYVDQLELDIVREDPRGAMEFRVGPAARITLKVTPDRGPEEQTRASWRVTDLRAELDHLKTRGVEPVEYELPGLRTENGIADLGFAHGAWIADPANNVIGLMQYPT